MAPTDYDYYPSSILWLFLAPAIGGFLFGYDIGGTSYAILQLASEEYESSPFSLSNAPLKTGWFVSATSAGALLGTALLVYIENHQKNHGSGGAGRKTATATASATATKKTGSGGRLSALLLTPIGRRDELKYAGVLYALGGLCQLMASVVANMNNDIDNINNINNNINDTAVVSSWNAPFAIVSIGRWIYGAGIGFAMHGGPTYLAETTPPTVRGMVVGAKEIAIVVGMLTGYWIGNGLCTPTTTTPGSVVYLYPNGWAYVYGCTAVVAIAMTCFSAFIPESPRFLVSSTDAREASAADDEEETSRRISSDVLESLKFVWKPERAKQEHEMLMEIFESRHGERSDGGSSSSSSSPSSMASLFSNPSFRPALQAGLGLVFLQQITGQPSVLSYATPILARVPGLSSSSSVLLALFKVLATSVSVVLVEKNGRKILLTIGCSLMLVALLVLTFAFQDDNDDNDNENDNETGTIDTRSLFVIGGMFTYIAGYQIGFGPISWLMISEVFPQSIRGTAVALAVQTNFALNAVVQFLVPILQSELGLSSTFLLFGCLTAYSLYFIQQNVPETKGLTLEEIEEKLSLLAARNNNKGEAKAKTDEQTRLLSSA